MATRLVTGQEAPPLDVGASQNAIRAHYDVGDDFFRLWLDGSMTYSGALWSGAGDDLERAQIRKLDFHLDTATPKRVQRLLDIGCGWGSLLERWASTVEESTSVGLTLSESQAAFVRAGQISGAEVRLESWRSHVPAAPYDRIVSIGALEHFVRPEMSRDQRVQVYQEFFDSCRSWMSINGVMSLQTIAYARGSFTHGAIADIFPESDLPRLSEIAEACEGTMEIVALRSDGGDYARTCGEWHERLSGNLDKAAAIVGANTARHYQKFLAASRLGFEARVFTLLRMTLRPY